MQFLMRLLTVVTLCTIIFTGSHVVAKRHKSCNACSTNSATIPIADLVGTTIAISPNEHCIASADSGNNRGQVSLFAFNDKCCTINPEMIGAVNLAGAFANAFSPDGKCLAVTNIPGALSLFKVNSCNCSIDQNPLQVIELGKPGVDVKFSPNGECLAVALRSLGSSRIAIFTFCKKSCKLAANPVQLIDVPFLPLSLNYSPQGDCLAVAGDFGLNLYKVDPCTCNISLSQVINTQGLFSATVAFSPCGKCFAVSGINDQETQIDIFSFDKNTCTAALIQTVNPGGDTNGGISYSQDGRCLIFAQGNGATPNLIIYNVNKATCLIEPFQTINLDDRTSPAAVSVKDRCFVVKEAGALNGILKVFKLGCSS